MVCLELACAMSASLLGSKWICERASKVSVSVPDTFLLHSKEGEPVGIKDDKRAGQRVDRDIDPGWRQNRTNLAAGCIAWAGRKSGALKHQRCWVLLKNCVEAEVEGRPLEKSLSSPCPFAAGCPSTPLFLDCFDGMLQI